MLLKHALDGAASKDAETELIHLYEVASIPLTLKNVLHILPP
jgi:multimeric flavodoxin WrbA